MENCILHDGSLKKKKKRKKMQKGEKKKLKIYSTSGPTLQTPKFPNLTNAPTLAPTFTRSLEFMAESTYGRVPATVRAH